MNTPARGPSLRTVAEVVGVSVAAVSNAYNKPDHLSATLRDRIFAAARELGYAGPGLRAVEQLRLVFAELHAVTVRQVVSFHRVDQMFGMDGQLRDAAAANTAAEAMLAQLSWWACALRNARAESKCDV